MALSMAASLASRLPDRSCFGLFPAPNLGAAGSEVLGSKVPLSSVGSRAATSAATSVGKVFCCVASSSSNREKYFQRDVVNFGSRFNRPDRFAQLRPVQPSMRLADVNKWLQALSQHLATVDVDAQLAHVNRTDILTSEEAQEMNSLIKRGALEECIEMRKTSANNAETSGRTQGEHEVASVAASHLDFISAAVASGSIETAFEYVGLLPPSMLMYNMLLACYVLSGHHSMRALVIDTAAQRDLHEDELTYALLATSALQQNDDKRFNEVVKDASTAGYFQFPGGDLKGILTEALGKAFA